MISYGSEFIQRFDAELQFWQFLRGLHFDDLIVELIQNGGDAVVLRPARQVGQLPDRGLRDLSGTRGYGSGEPASPSVPGLGLAEQPCGTAKTDRGAGGHALPHQATTGPQDAGRAGGGGLAEGAFGDLRRGLQLQLLLLRRCDRPGQSHSKLTGP